MASSAEERALPDEIPGLVGRKGDLFGFALLCCKGHIKVREFKPVLDVLAGQHKGHRHTFFAVMSIVEYSNRWAENPMRAGSFCAWLDV